MLSTSISILLFSIAVIVIIGIFIVIESIRTHKSKKKLKQTKVGDTFIYRFDANNPFKEHVHSYTVRAISPSLNNKTAYLIVHDNTIENDYFDRTYEWAIFNELFVKTTNQ